MKQYFVICFLILMSGQIHAQLVGFAETAGLPTSVDFVPFSQMLTGFGLPAMPVGEVPFSVMEDVTVLENLVLPPAPQAPSGIPAFPAFPTEAPPIPNIPLAGFGEAKGALAQ